MALQDDPISLLAYVKEHPENKMAWYLLGRHYQKSGQLDQARRCFEHAGEIYEAFEQDPLGALRAAERTGQADERQRSLHAANSPRHGEERASGRKRTWFRALFVTVWAVLFLLLAPAPSVKHDAAPAGGSADQAAGGGGPSDAGTAAVVAPAGMDMLLLPAGGTPDGWKQAVGEALLSKEPAVLTVGFTQPITDGTAWIDWNHAPRVLFSIDHPSLEGKAEIRYHDSALCSCQAQSPGSLTDYVRLWKEDQEQGAVLFSAIAAYAARNGAAPLTPDALVRDYPNNFLPAVTEQMRNMFPGLVSAAVKARSSTDAAQAPAASGDAASPGNGTQATPGEPPKADRDTDGWFPLNRALAQPLEIVIDKNNHSLAVVSGTILLREYPVGLGGGKTPEGTFEITEKVRNPNGKSNGEFGSRGMVLSGSQYAIHGTNQPKSIGRDWSHGCIRMRKADIEELFDLVPLYTKVTIRSGGLPDKSGKPEKPFRLSPSVNEQNPHKTYHWLK